jgi:hypothetical protein
MATRTPPPDPIYFESNKTLTGIFHSTKNEKVIGPAVTGVRDDVNRLQRERNCHSIFSLINC